MPTTVYLANRDRISDILKPCQYIPGPRFERIPERTEGRDSIIFQMPTPDSVNVMVCCGTAGNVRYALGCG